MKKVSIKTILTFALTLIVGTSFGQIKLLKGVRDNMMDDRFKDLKLAKYEIDKVMLDPDTKDLCASFAWKGVVYSDIALSTDEEILALDADGTAAKQAGEAFLKYFACGEEEQERYDAKEAAKIYLTYAGIACFNKGIQASDQKGNFNVVKDYMTIVDKLMAYDKDEKLKGNNVSSEKANYLIWRAAYIDSLVDQEIIYLQKLMDYPSYMNSDVFVRMAEIYSARKEYEKAMGFLEKGKAKIPQKSSSFLDMQINIEIDR
ncbi:MAG: hypothetical protein R2852_09420, partial [Bacteroidia bacterium]